MLPFSDGVNVASSPTRNWFTLTPIAVAAVVIGVAVLAVPLALRDGPIIPFHAAAPVPEYHEWLFAAPERTEDVDAVVREAVAKRLIPGATVVIGRGAHTIELADYGRVGWAATDAPTSADSTIYDVASLTKALATTTAVLLLVQDGKIRLDDPIQRRLKTFRGGRWKERVTWRQLLTHTSGLPASVSIKGKTRPARLSNLLRTPLTAPPGQRVQYSDVGYIVLYEAAQRVAGQPLPKFLARRVWGPLGMRSTSYWPGALCTRCAPTSTLALDRGEPSDPMANAIGGPTGNAGLFSTAHDVGRFAAMVANGGTLDGVRVFRPDLVAALAQQVPRAGHRTLGWEAFCPDEKLTEQQPCKSPVAFGHTGWTGTSFWIDQVTRSWVVVLSNRTYDVRRPPSLDPLRAEVFDRTVAAGF